MTEDEAENFRLWGGLLLLANQHPGGSAAWAVNKIERLQKDAAAERERCVRICVHVLRSDLADMCIGWINSGKTP